MRRGERPVELCQQPSVIAVFLLKPKEGQSFVAINQASFLVILINFKHLNFKKLISKYSFLKVA